MFPYVFPRHPVQRGLCHRMRHGAACGHGGHLRLLGRGHRLSLEDSRSGRRRAVRRRFPGMAARLQADGRYRCRARGAGRVPERAPRSRQGPDHAVPAARGGASQLRELPDAHCDQGGARVPCGAGCARGRVRLAPCPGRGRRPVGVAREHRGRLRIDFERARGQDVRPPCVGHARPLVGHGISLRARGVPRLCGGVSQKLYAARGYLQRRAGYRQRDHRRP